MDSENPTPPVRPVRRRRRLYETPAHEDSTLDAAEQPPAPDPEKKRYGADRSLDAALSEAAEPLDGDDEADSKTTRPQYTPASEAVKAKRVKDAEKIVKTHLGWSMAFGLLPFPLIDTAAVAGVQINMLNRLCNLYRQPFSEQQAKVVIAALVGGANSGLISFALTRTLGRFIPLLGLISMALAAGALTYAVGRVFILHFEMGGTFLSFDAEKMREHFAQEHEKGAQVARELHKDTH